MMKLRINSEEFIGFTEVSMIDSVDTLCNQIKIKCASENSGFQFPIKRGSNSEVVIDEHSIFEGSIEKSKGRAGQDSYEILTEGRDNQSQIIKSDLRPDINFKGPISLISIIEKSLSRMGISRVVKDETGGIDDFTKKELANEDVGTEIFQYWVKLAEKRNCLVSKDRTGAIVLRRPNQRKYKKKLYRLINDIKGVNNIIESDWDFDDSERCHEYNVYGQENKSVPRDISPPASDEVDSDPIPATEQEDYNPAVDAEKNAIIQQMNLLDPNSEKYRVLAVQLDALGGTASAGQKFRRSSIATKGTATDNGVPVGTYRHEEAEDPSDDEECDRLARWKCNTERAKSVSYTCTLIDLYADDEPWESGYLIDVVDEIADIDSTMMVRTVEFNSAKDEGGGVDETVALTLTIPDAFTDTESADNALINIDRIGANWNEGDFR